MYTAVLDIHSLIRWLVILFGLLAIVRAFRGWFGRKEWRPQDDRVGLWFTVSLDTQTLFGMLLYLFFSPITTSTFQNSGAAMADSERRFWAVEHITMMVLALVFAHIGRALSKKGNVPARRHRQAAFFYLIALLVIFFGVPWPFSRQARPLLPFL